MAALDLDGLRRDGRFRGRAGSHLSQTGGGRYVRAAPLRERERGYDLAAAATLRSALLRQAGSGRGSGLGIEPQDLRKKIYRRRVRSLVVFVVDCSESMGEDGAQARIRAAKGTILGILTRAYQKRFRVGLVAFYEECAEVVLQPTASLTLAQKRLSALPVGGATPFALGLMRAWRLIRTERSKDPEIRPLLVILSDGEANVPYGDDVPPQGIIGELLDIGQLIGGDGVDALVIETRPLRDPSDTMRRLAGKMGGRYYHGTSLRNADLLRAVAAF